MNNQNRIIDATERVANTVRDLHTCVVCCKVSDNLIYDEFIAGYVCHICDTKRELGVI